MASSLPLVPPAHFFSARNGGVYGFIIRSIPSARPFIHARATNTCTPAYDSVRARACVGESPSVADRARARSFPLGAKD